MLDRLRVARVGGAHRQADDLHAHAQRRMQHIHHGVDPGHVQRQIGDHVLRRVFEILKGVLRFQGAYHESVHGPIRHGDGFVNAADGAGGMQDDV